MWIADKYPELNDKIKQRIQEGRWELVGGMWVEPDLNMPDGESLVRQFLVGQATFQKLMASTTRIGWNPDSFGYNWQLPQIHTSAPASTTLYAEDDLERHQPAAAEAVLVGIAGRQQGADLFPPRLCQHESESGAPGANILWRRRTLAPGLDEMMDLFGVGDHGGGPTRALLDAGAALDAADKVVPSSEFGTAQPFF